MDIISLRNSIERVKNGNGGVDSVIKNLFGSASSNDNHKTSSNKNDNRTTFYSMNNNSTHKIFGNHNNEKYSRKVQEITKEEKDQILEKLKEAIMTKVKDQMVDEDFQDMFDKIKNWIDKNINTTEDAEKFAEDPSPLMEELGIYTLDDIFHYIQETFQEDSDMMKGIKQSANLVIDGKNTVDEIVDSIYPVIKADMESKEIFAPEYLVRLAIRGMILREKKNKTSIIVSEQEQPKEETIIKDAEFEDIEPITFDDSGLVEVKHVQLNEDGETIIVRPLTEGAMNIVINYNQLIQENDKYYIPIELLQQNSNFRDEVKDKINRIVSRDEFKTLMKGIDETQVRVDINPANDPNMFDSVMLNTEDKHIMIMLDFDGKYITKHSKVLVMFNQGESFIALPLSEGLFQELLTKNKEEFIKKNILSDEVMQLSHKLNLLDIPVSSFTTVVNKILRNKSLRKVILNSIDKFFIFDGKITSKKFTITDGSNYYHYNNGKVTKSLVPSGN